MVTFARRLAVLVAGALAVSASAATVSITIDRPAAGVLHALINAGRSSPPPSPFVPAAGSAARPLSGTLDSVIVKSSTGAALLKLESATVSGNSIQLVFLHDPSDRYYGSGNAGMSDSGPLVHASGRQIVHNGVTRVPFIWSPAGYGILVANDIHPVSAHIEWNDAHGRLTWTVPDAFADVYLMAAPGMYGVLGQYARLTGCAPIPPRWTFGFLQSRWGYSDAADVQDKWRQFRDRKIPIDAFIYDYDWFANDWEFDPKHFPDPAAELAQMHSMNLHFVGIRKPRASGENLDFARSQGWLLAKSDLRFDLAPARDWWWGHQLRLLEKEVDGWWNDEAENAYDEFFYMSKQQYEGGRAATTRRQWSLDRAFAPGIQHYGAAAWTGDITSNWGTLAQQPGTLLNWSMAGMPYVSQDTGGFFGQPDPELYTRWMQTSAFIPVMRSHGDHNSPRWPWAFGDEAQADITKVLQLRYRMIPYLYTVAEEVHRTGVPWMRPLFMEFPEDQKTWDLRDEWLVGDCVLAAPVLAPAGVRKVYLPAGDWFDGNTGVAVPGGRTLDLTPVPLDVVPLFVRAGSILPLGPVKQSTAEREDPLEVRVYPGANAEFTLYEDAGDNYDYEKGAFTRIPLRWNDRQRTLTVEKREGSYPGMLKERHLLVVLPAGVAKQAVYSGERLRVQF